MSDTSQGIWAKLAGLYHQLNPPTSPNQPTWFDKMASGVSGDILAPGGLESAVSGLGQSLDRTTQAWHDVFTGSGTPNQPAEMIPGVGPAAVDVAHAAAQPSTNWPQLVGMGLGAAVGPMHGMGDANSLVKASSLGRAGEALGAMGEDASSAKPPFFSNVLNAFSNPKIPNTLTREQALTVLKSPGVKGDELKWLGLEDQLRSKSKWSKSEIQDYIRDNQIDVHEVTKSPLNLGRPGENPTGGGAKYQKYTLPGGSNYREVLMKWGNPQIPNKPVDPPLSFERWLGEGNTEFPTDRHDYQRYVNNYEWATKEMGVERNDFQSSHFPDDPNILAHLRLTDRTLPDGRKLLFAEEMQSDWQKGLRKQDAVNADPTKSWDYRASQILHEKGLGDYAPLTQDHLDNPSTIDQYKDVGSNDTPNAPLARNYPELTMKRLLRMGAEGGYDGVGWTTGSQQAKRYNQTLLENVTGLKYDPRTQLLEVSGPNPQNNTISVSQLPNLVGRDLAEKLLSSLNRDHRGEIQPGEVTGTNLQVGERGFSDLYDKQLSSLASRMGKKFGATYQQVKIPLQQGAPDFNDVININTTRGLDPRIPEFVRSAYWGNPINPISELVERLNGVPEGAPIANRIQTAIQMIRNAGGSKTELIHHLPLTPTLRKSALQEGFPLFQVAAPLATGATAYATSKDKKPSAPPSVYTLH